MDKYQELFRLSKYVLDEEVQRFVRIDEKASKYLSAITILFGLVAFMFKWSLDNFIPLENTIDYVGIISLGLVIVFLAIAWFFSFNVLKISTLRKMPMNTEMIDFFNKNNLLNIYFALSKRFADAYQENVAKTNKKLIYLTLSYRFIICALISSLLLFSLMGIKAYNKTNERINCKRKEVMLCPTMKEMMVKPNGTLVNLKSNPTQM